VRVTKAHDTQEGADGMQWAARIHHALSLSIYMCWEETKGTETRAETETETAGKHRKGQADSPHWKTP
jgi:hypothetical protein